MPTISAQYTLTNGPAGGRALITPGGPPPKCAPAATTPEPACAVVVTAASLPASRIASSGSSTPNPTDGAYPPFGWSRADIASARPTSAGGRCGYRSLISAAVAATSAPAVPKSSSCHPVEEASIVSAGPAMRTELLASARDGENGAGPPGSITAETPMIPGSPVGYPYLHFCLSAEPIVTLAITTFRE